MSTVACRLVCSSLFRAAGPQGAHKINNAIGQALLAKRLGKKRIIAETGAGQHGVVGFTTARASPPARVLFDVVCALVQCSFSTFCLCQATATACALMGLSPHAREHGVQLTQGTPAMPVSLVADA